MGRKVHSSTAQIRFLNERITTVVSFIKTMGSHPLKFKGLFKNTVVSVCRGDEEGDQQIQVEANKEQAKKNSQSCETLLLKIMTEIYDCFLPRQKGAQLEGRKQQALCTSMLCFAYSITHWLGDKNKQDNTLSNPRRRGRRESW